MRTQIIEILQKAYPEYKHIDTANEIVRLLDNKPKKHCPHCNSDKVEMFDSDNDICKDCGRWFPAL